MRPIGPKLNGFKIFSDAGKHGLLTTDDMNSRWKL